MKRWVNSAAHALRGIVLFSRTERNARIEWAMAILAVLLGIWLHIPRHEWCILILVIGSVLAAEAFNSAIERLADLHSRERRPDIGALKDIAAGAVLILALAALIIGCILFLPRLFPFFFS